MPQSPSHRKTCARGIAYGLLTTLGCFAGCDCDTEPLVPTTDHGPVADSGALNDRAAVDSTSPDDREAPDLRPPDRTTDPGPVQDLRRNDPGLAMDVETERVSLDGSLDGGATDGPRDIGTDSAPDIVVDTFTADLGPIDAGPDLCAPGPAICADHRTLRSCQLLQRWEWVDERCPDGQGCLAGECVADRCSDSCNLGEVRGERPARAICELHDLTTGSWVAPDDVTSMHNRARTMNMWLRRDSLPHGGIGNARYSDPPDYTIVSSNEGIGDSAIWTGSYLAGEAYRLLVTGSRDARENVRRLVETLHLWFNVSGHPGLLARYTAPVDHLPVVHFSCADPHHHCDVPYQGQNYNYIGHISRDQYQGVMLGYALAYQALGEADEATRALIREDVVELVQTLMQPTAFWVRITIDSLSFPPFLVTSRFILLAPDEMVDGAVDIRATTSFDEPSLTGMQEFLPDWGSLLDQIPVVGALVPDSIPRAGSAIMLASYFQVALLVTEGIPEYETTRASMQAFYTGNNDIQGNVNDWLDVADGWSYSQECGDKYFGINIAMQPMHNLARLEQNPNRRNRILYDVLESRMWQTTRYHKNVFFDFIYAANVELPMDPLVGSRAAAQLATYPPPPRVRYEINLREDPRYFPHDSDCEDHTSHDTAIDVGDRGATDFLWQYGSWSLYYAPSLRQTYPGTDYILAYWMGRFHGFIDEDAAGRCTAWRSVP